MKENKISMVPQSISYMFPNALPSARSMDGQKQIPMGLLNG
jgi:hypothetical protein